MSSQAVAEECADLIVAGFPSYWNKPLLAPWRKNLAVLLKRHSDEICYYLADPQTGLATGSTYLLDGVELLRAFRRAVAEVNNQASQQASKFPKAVEG